MDRYIKETDLLNALYWEEDNQVWELTHARLEKLQRNAIEIETTK